MTAAVGQWPVLQGLVPTGAGYFRQAAGFCHRDLSGGGASALIYCLRGAGWCRIGGRLHAVRGGDLVVIPRAVPHEYGARRSDPWTLYWVRAEGGNLAEYFRALGVDARVPVVRLGEDLQAIALFNELLQDLRQGTLPEPLFHAAHTLGHLLSVLIRRRSSRFREPSEGVGKVARVIDYLSEHQHEPLTVVALARLVNLSPDHFSALFKRQTGCTPYAYLQLLRMHRAAEWLTGTALPVEEIADRLGYGDPFHFSRQFKRFHGASPSAFRRRSPGFVHAKPGSFHVA